MTLNLPPLSSHLRQSAREETQRVLRWIDQARIEEIEPLLIGRASRARISVQIDLTVSAQETLRSLTMSIADPRGADLLRQLPVAVFGDRQQDVLALESQVYINFMTLILERRYPDGRPYLTASETTLEELLKPDLSPINVVRRVAGHPNPDASLTGYFSVLHAWREMEHRRGESHHARIERLRKRAASGGHPGHPKIEEPRT